MKVAIVGATGYGGIELVRILRQHRRVEELSVYSSSYAGTSFGAFYPHIQDIYRGILKSVETKQLADDYDIVFVSAPPGVAAELMEGLLDGNARVIDLSGDFRIQDRSVYEAWYERNAAKQSFIQEAAYGLSEWNREKIENARLIANPGCYPTAILNGLAPLVKENVLDMSSIIIDAKSGTTGAGKNPSAMTHFSEMNESLKIYKVNEHKHTPEIEQVLSEWNPAAQPVTFTPHLVPMTRGSWRQCMQRASHYQRKTFSQSMKNIINPNRSCEFVKTAFLRRKKCIRVILMIFPSRLMHGQTE